jgi:hypothetical protein
VNAQSQTSSKPEFDWMIPIGGVLFVIGVTLSLYYAADLENDTLPLSKLPQLQWRLAWAVSALALVCALVWTAIICLVAMLQVFKKVKKIDKGEWYLGLLVLVAVAYYCLNFKWELSPQTRTSTALVNAIAACTRVDIRSLISIGNTATAVTVGIVLLACSSHALRLRQPSTKDIEERFRLYPAMLYSSSVLTVVGVLEMYALQRWGASYGAYCSANTDTSIAEGYALAMGAIYSLMLVMLFLPLAILRNKWLRRLLAEKRSNSRDVEQVSVRIPVISVASVGAMLLPILTSLATAVAKRSIGAGH